MTLLEKVKESLKEGVDFLEIEKLYKSELDAETSKRVENHDAKFKVEKLPGLVAEESKRLEKEITLKLQPNETPEQKRIKELELKIQANEKKEKDSVRKTELREKAKALAEAEKVPYDPTRAELLYVYGEEAESILEKDIKYLKSTLEKELSSKIKGQYSKDEPKSGMKMDGLDKLTYDELNKLAIEKPDIKPAIFSEIDERIKTGKL